MSATTATPATSTTTDDISPMVSCHIARAPLKDPPNNCILSNGLCTFEAKDLSGFAIYDQYGMAVSGISHLAWGAIIKHGGAAAVRRGLTKHLKCTINDIATCCLSDEYAATESMENCFDKANELAGLVCHHVMIHAPHDTGIAWCDPLPNVPKMDVLKSLRQVWQKTAENMMHDYIYRRGTEVGKPEPVMDSSDIRSLLNLLDCSIKETEQTERSKSYARNKALSVDALVKQSA